MVEIFDRNPEDTLEIVRSNSSGLPRKLDQLSSQEPEAKSKLTFGDFKDEKGRIHWTELATQPELLQTILEAEAEKYINEGFKLTFKDLLKAHRSDIVNGAQFHYPRGLHGLQEHFGLANRRKRRSTESLRSADEVARIKGDAERFFQEFGDISLTTLRKHNRVDLYTDIQNYYPGKLSKIKEELGLEVRTIKTDYWTTEQIKKEALAFIQQQGKLSTPILSQKRPDLNAAIARKYPGGIYQLRADLKVAKGQRPNKYWMDIENIKKEAHAFYQQQGTFTQRLLIDSGRSDIWSAAVRYYPGGFGKFRDDLGFAKEKVVTAKISPQEANADLDRLFDII